MNINSVSFYLNGNLPPYYRAPYNILIFCNKAREISNWRIKDKDIYELSNFWYRWQQMFLAVLEILTPCEQKELIDYCVPIEVYEDITWESSHHLRWKLPENLITKKNSNMNYYNTAAILIESSYDTKIIAKRWAKKPDREVLPFKVRMGTSKKSVEAQMIRELPLDTDIDTIDFLISEIF